MLFKLRTQMVDVAMNFKSAHENLYCPLCTDISRHDIGQSQTGTVTLQKFVNFQLDSTHHMLVCKKLNENLRLFYSAAKFSDVFSENFVVMKEIGERYETLVEQRKGILEK